MGGLYAAYAGINAAYRRTLNGVRSTGKKNTHLLVYRLQNATVPSEGTHPAGEGACRSTTILWACRKLLSNNRLSVAK